MVAVIADVIISGVVGVVAGGANDDSTGGG